MIMFLRRLGLNNFKNYTSAEIELSEKLNCFVGLNGAGKTNVLEAVYYLAFCKSCFTSVDRQNIRHGEDFFAIHGDVVSDTEGEFVVSCALKDEGRKIFKINKKECERLSDHIGRIPLVMISPYDSDLINGGSELRRKFIDGVISQFDSAYLDSLLRYNKVLVQRNTLLKYFYDNHTYDYDSLSVWDEQLATLASRLHEKRRDFINDFVPLFQKYYKMVSGTAEIVNIVYESQLHEKDMSRLLDENRDKDRFSTYTTAGIHKDDLIFNINGFPVKKTGSQGQQKSFVVAVKLAQFDSNYNKIGYKPILLLDDIFDKLDEKRVKQLVRLVGEDHFGQVFITDTQRSRIDSLFNDINVEHRVFEVENGTVKTD